MGDDARPNIQIDDIIVLLLGAPSESPEMIGRINGITRLEKLVFLLERESELSGFLTESADFEAYNFGPFSSKIYQAVETLASAGLITDSSTAANSVEDSWETQKIVGLLEGTPYKSRDFQLTEKGRRYYQALRAELDPSAELKLKQFKDKFALIPLRQLIRYVYKRYPRWTDNSLIKDEVLG